MICRLAFASRKSVASNFSEPRMQIRFCWWYIIQLIHIFTFKSQRLCHRSIRIRRQTLGIPFAAASKVSPSPSPAALRRTFSHFLRSRAANFPYRVSPASEKWWATSAAKLPLPRSSPFRLRIEFGRNREPRRRSRITADAHEARTSDAMANIYASDAQFRNSFSRSSALRLIDVAVHLVWMPLMQLQLLGERRRKNGQLLWLN